jgi:hypothetical protein
VITNCKECLVAGDGVCNRFRFVINKEYDGCPWGVKELPTTCSCCGQYINGKANLVAGRVDVALCDECFVRSCRTCCQAAECVFETDSSPLPKVVEQRIEQGPMIQIMQVRNPERIAVTCAVKCKCYNKEFGCMRETGVCPNWNPSY